MTKHMTISATDAVSVSGLSLEEQARFKESVDNPPTAYRRDGTCLYFRLADETAKRLKIKPEVDLSYQPEHDCIGITYHRIHEEHRTLNAMSTAADRRGYKGRFDRSPGRLLLEILLDRASLS